MINADGQAYLHLIELSLLAFMYRSVGRPLKLEFTEMLGVESIWVTATGCFTHSEARGSDRLIYNKVGWIHELLLASVLTV